MSLCVSKHDSWGRVVCLKLKQHRMCKGLQLIALATILAGLVVLMSFSFVHSAESPTVLSLAAGGRHTCAVLSNGTIRCWGNNSDGRLGNGKLAEDYGRTVQVANISAARQIAVGLNFSCAGLADGTVRCWGGNQYGQLGNGTTNKAIMPVTVIDLHSATAVTAGFFHACALSNAGSIACWGRNDHGQLGDGTQIDSLIPVPVKGVTAAMALSAGLSHTCALLKTGIVRCWGSNQWGELGNGTKIDALVPVDVVGLQSVAAIGTGNNFSCAVITSGRVKCWGDNRQGQLGNGTSKEALVPEEAKGISSAIKVDGGSLHACALLRQGTVNCWGFNQTGQLGYSTRDDTTRPVHEQGIFVPDEVIGLRSAREVTTGLMHSCALEDRTTVKCWGGNTNGGYFTAMVGTSTTMPIDIKVVP